MKIEDLEKALQYFVIAVPESEEQAKAYFWARKALTALRSMQEAGEPLSLEQLQEMDGQPVWIVEYPDWGHWELSEDAEDYLCDRDTDLYGFMSDLDGEAGFHELGWLAYPYPPAHIDRSKWISVKNKKLLPKIKERVLSRLWYPDIGEVVVENQYYGNGMWMEETSAITHWMPLPEPPEEGVFLSTPSVWRVTAKSNKIALQFVSK